MHIKVFILRNHQNRLLLCVSSAVHPSFSFVSYATVTAMSQLTFSALYR